MKRGGAILAAAIPGFTLPLPAREQQTVIEIHKSLYCGCCTDWIKHLKQNGFTVKAHDAGDPSLTRRP